MQFKFNYSLEKEKEMIKSFYDLKEWMVKFGYGKVAIFPKNADPFKKSLEELYQLLNEEYDEKDYKKAVLVAKKSINSVKAEFSKFMIDIFGKKIDREYLVTLSKYGYGGLYGLPNLIGVQFSFFKGDTIKYIIMHETTHLFFEEDVQKYEVSQHEKERINYLLLKKSKLVPDDMQHHFFDNVEKYIDPLFDELFLKNKEEFFKQIKNRRKFV